MKRVFFDILLFLSVLLLPWWASLFLAILGLFIFNKFYEYLIFGVIVFVLYSTRSSRIISSPVYFALILTLSFALIEIVKRNIIFYKK
jgi:hypothetical protein